MHFEDFALAATTDNLSFEKDVREYADFIELRWNQTASPMAQLKEYSGDLPIIVAFQETGEDNEPSDYLETAKEVSELKHVEFLDIPVDLAEEFDRQVNEIRTTANVIISYESLANSPQKEQLESVMERCSDLGDCIKISMSIKNRSDSLMFLNLLSEAARKEINIIGDPIDDTGLHTQILALHHGSKIGYAPIHSEEYVKEGKTDIKSLHSLLDEIEHGADDVELTEALKGRF